MGGRWGNYPRAALHGSMHCYDAIWNERGRVSAV